jgi:hypothetical protein
MLRLFVHCLLLCIRIVSRLKVCVTPTKCNTDQYTEHKKWPWSIRLRLKCDGTRAETRFRLSAKRTSPFKSARTSVQSPTGSRGVRISGSNAGYTMFRGSVKSTGYPLHSPVSPSLPLPCVTVCHHISTGLYQSQKGRGCVVRFGTGDFTVTAELHYGRSWCLLAHFEVTVLRLVWKT